MTPSFIIIGARKCGTSTVYTGLNMHPEIRMVNGPDDVSEIRYFDQYSSRGDEWYRSLFTGRGVEGEKSPAYLGEKYCHPHLTRVCPNAKLIAFLRDPVTRAYSEWNDGRQHGWIQGLYAQHTFEDLWKTWPNCPAFRHGLYADHLESLYRFYARTGVHIEISERFWADNRQGFRRLHRFLSVGPYSPHKYPRIRQARYGAPMGATMRETLKSYYKPYTERLRRLLGDEIPEWDV